MIFWWGSSSSSSPPNHEHVVPMNERTNERSIDCPTDPTNTTHVRTLGPPGSVYQLTMATYAIALSHFLMEAFVFRTAR